MIKAYIGKQRSGKTVRMTQDVIGFLEAGHVVYVNYRINWDNMAYKGWLRTFLHRVGIWKITRYPQTNLRRFVDWEDVLHVSNAVIALDEGWQYFDSYQKLPIDKRMRLYQSGKWELTYLYTVQRYMMADINLRWSTDEFWESTMYKIPFLSYPLIVYKLYDLDEDNESAKLARKGIDEKGNIVDLALSRRFVFTTKKMFAYYDTKEDIYADEQNRLRLAEKIDARGTDVGGFVDPTPTYWTSAKKLVTGKHDVRRSPRAKRKRKVQGERGVVERLPRRNDGDIVRIPVRDGIVPVVRVGTR